MHKGTTGEVDQWLWQSPAFQRLFGEVRSASQAEPHSHTVGCPTPPPQQAEGASPGIPAASPQAARNLCPSRRLALGNAIGLGPHAQWAQGAHAGCGATWDKQQLAQSRATPVCQTLPGPTGLRALIGRHLAARPSPGAAPVCRALSWNLGQDPPGPHSPRPAAAPPALSLEPSQGLPRSSCWARFCGTASTHRNTLKLKSRFALLARKRGSRQPLPTLSVWSGTVGQDCAEPWGEEPEVQRKLQDRTKPTGPCLLPCTPLHPRPREQSAAHTLSGWERGTGPRAPGLSMEHRVSSWAGPLRHPKHRQGPRQSRKDKRCSPPLLPRAPAQAPTMVPHGEHQPTSGIRTGRLLHRAPLNAAGVTETRWASQHLTAQRTPSAVQPLPSG